MHKNDDPTTHAVGRALADWIARSSDGHRPLDAASADRLPAGRIVRVADGPGGGDRSATLEHLAELARKTGDWRDSIAPCVPGGRVTKVKVSDLAANQITANRIDVVAAKPDLFSVAPTSAAAEAEARATALALTIAAQEDEITTLRGMLGLREAQVRDLRDLITDLTKKVAFLEAEERRERAAARARPTRAEPPGDGTGWTTPTGLLPRGMR